jgi:DnaJ-class molecular chaperone
MRDPYSILGVSKSADQQEIKSAWRAAAKALHPDQNPGDPQAASRFTEAGRAYDLLKDPDKRRIFDESRARTSAGPVPPGPGGGAQSARAGKEKTFMEQRAERARAEAEARAAADARARAEARAAAATAAAAGGAGAKSDPRDPADEAADKIFAARKPSEPKSEAQEPPASARTAARPEPAPHPEPAAATAPEDRHEFETPAEKAAAEARTSPALELITYVLKRLTRQVPPPEKAPDHIIDLAVSIEDVLRKTGQTVTLADGKPLTVPMPDDAKDGTRIRFDGLGYRLQGVKRGDVVVVLRIKPHTWYRPHGYDLLTYVDIDIENAVLGCETSVETPDGSVTVTIPPWSGSQYKAVIPGHGLPKGAGQRGDLIAEARVHLWDRPDQRVIDLMRSMREGLYL